MSLIKLKEEKKTGPSSLNKITYNTVDGYKLLKKTVSSLLMSVYVNLSMQLAYATCMLSS